MSFAPHRNGGSADAWSLPQNRRARLAQNTVNYGLPFTTTAHKYNDGPRERRFLTLSTAPARSAAQYPGNTRERPESGFRDFFPFREFGWDFGFFANRLPPPPRLWGLRAVTSRRAHMLSVFWSDFSASAILHATFWDLRLLKVRPKPTLRRGLVWRVTRTKGRSSNSPL